jgi:hypothetical protein
MMRIITAFHVMNISMTLISQDARTKTNADYVTADGR